MKKVKKATSVCFCLLVLFFTSLSVQASCYSCDGYQDDGWCYRGTINKTCLDAYFGEELDCDKVYSLMEICPQ